MFKGRHCTADIGAVCILLAVFDGNEGFGIFGGNAEQTADPGPKDSARTADGDRRADTDDVAGTDRRRQGSHQRAEDRKIALLVRIVLQ